MPTVLISKMARADKAKAEPSRVLIADEFPLVCETLADKVNATEDLVSCGRADDTEGVIGAIEELQPDALVLSLHLPNAVGFELIRKIRLTHPELFISQRTVESHRDHIKTKLRVDDIFKLHQMAFEWVQEDISPRP